MKDAVWEKKKAKVQAVFERWIKHLGLGWYEVDLNWKAGDGEDRGEGFIRCMEVRSKWMYRTATINIWLEEVPDDPYKLERMVVHELCHILIEPMRSVEGVTDNEEYVAESLARAILWTVEGIKQKKL